MRQLHSSTSELNPSRHLNTFRRRSLKNILPIWFSAQDLVMHVRLNMVLYLSRIKCGGTLKWTNMYLNRFVECNFIPNEQRHLKLKGNSSINDTCYNITTKVYYLCTGNVNKHLIGTTIQCHYYYSPDIICLVSGPLDMIIFFFMTSFYFLPRPNRYNLYCLLTKQFIYLKINKSIYLDLKSGFY